MLPDSPDSLAAIGNLEKLVSFSPYFGSTSNLVDLFLPDHLPQGSYGYNLTSSQADRGLVQAIIPTQSPPRNSRASIDVLLEASKRLDLDKPLPYRNETEFVHAAVGKLMNQAGDITSSDAKEFVEIWHDRWSWQRRQSVRFPPRWVLPPGRFEPYDYSTTSRSIFHLLVFPLSKLRMPTGDQAAWAELHPDAAADLGLSEGQLIRLSQAGSEVQLPLKLNRGLHPSTVALPYISGNPANRLLSGELNSSGGRIYSGKLVCVAGASVS